MKLIACASNLFAKPAPTSTFFDLEIPRQRSNLPVPLVRSLRLVLLFSLVFTLLTGIHSLAAESKKTEILWDTYGVPHIYSPNTKELFHAFGWA
ncbi:MAG TPA: hypothetical protein V6C91_10410, partial [Coleofasciculaceae cyanobacterium]